MREDSQWEDEQDELDKSFEELDEALAEYIKIDPKLVEQALMHLQILIETIQMETRFRKKQAYGVKR